jgi:DnaJ family protein C protein 2
MPFVLGPPSSSGATSWVAAPIPSAVVTTVLPGVVPVGTAALRMLGGKDRESTEKKGANGGFPEDKINIPVGITPENLSKFTLYDILGFTGDWGAAADVEAIRKAYHKAVLMYHPDKAQFKTSDGKEDRSVFLKIQEAFNVLTNDQKRRMYDSQLPFDESIPSEERIQKALAKGPQKFFKLFAPVFQRNARFAVKKPVPDVGDMDTPLNDVYKFYEYWVNFESWRDFTGVGAEHKPDDAGSREEKRWMMKENERIAKKLKKKEMERLINLVTSAEKNDPRINAEKERKRLAKENEKNAKENAARKKADEEAAAKEWAERMETEERERQAALKVDKEKLKKAMAKGRNILRKLLRFSAEMGRGSGEYGILSSNDVELLCSHAKLEDLNEMNDTMGGEPASKELSLVQEAGFDVVLAKLELAKTLHEQILEDERIAREAKKREADDKVAADRRNNNKKGGAAVVAEREWTRDEYSMLAKCVQRYPPGSQSRWVSITNYMNVQMKPTESYKEDELIRAAYVLAHNPQSVL